MKTHVFTDLDFARFDCAVKDWIIDLGMTEWNCATEHDQIGERVNAQVQYNCRSKSALFRLTKVTEGDFGMLYDSEKLALHEVLHLMLADFSWIAAMGKDDMADALVSHEHEIINRLMRLIERGGLRPGERK